MNNNKSNNLCNTRKRICPSFLYLLVTTKGWPGPLQSVQRILIRLWQNKKQADLKNNCATLDDLAK